jgi:hypothetical protein
MTGTIKAQIKMSGKQVEDICDSSFEDGFEAEPLITNQSLGEKNRKMMTTSEV